VRPEELLLVLYGAALSAILAVRGFSTGNWHVSAFEHPRFLQALLALAVLIWGRATWRARSLRAGLSPAMRVLRDFLPFFGALVLYEMLHDLTPFLRPSVVDARLVAIDRAVFGVDVAAWMSSWARPWLTHLMVHAYASYFVAPVILACVLYWRDQRRAFREYLVSLTVVTLLGYAGYLCVPAVGPYVFQADLFPTRLPGGGAETHFFIQQIDDLRGVARDCFPSMHTAHTTVVLAFAWRAERRFFFVYLPLALLLYVSTVYLRMHYVVDVAAGFAFAAFAIWLGPKIERRWGPNYGAGGPV
jgi:membrane-associated phospholipid phosphatase